MNINNLSAEELLELNKRIVRRLKELKSQGQVKAASQFRRGDIVSFKNKDGIKISGIILSIKKSKAKIITETSKQWEISPSLLTIEPSPSQKLLKILEQLFPPSVRMRFSTRKQP